MEPLPFAVLSEGSRRDARGRLSLESIIDSFTVESIPAITPELHFTAVFELSPEEAMLEPSVLVRMIDPDGDEMDMWRVFGVVVPVSGSTRDLYYVRGEFSNVPLWQTGRHEVRIQYDVDRPELAVTFEVWELDPDA